VFALRYRAITHYRYASWRLANELPIAARRRDALAVISVTSGLFPAGCRIRSRNQPVIGKQAASARISPSHRTLSIIFGIIDAGALHGEILRRDA